MQAAMQGKGMQGKAMDMHATHGGQGAQFVFPISDALRRLAPVQLARLGISFVRMDGGGRPAKGDVIRIKSFRVVADD
jgi:hypothetical protein